MVGIRIHGRGGQGGVTLAKLIATTWFLRGKHVQAFGVYAAERSGAPLQAFVRYDDQEITNHNLVRQPDHVVVLDRSLLGMDVAGGLKPGGWIVINTPQPPESVADSFPGYAIATIDATSIAVAHGLGSRAVPIVNTTMLGAIARTLGLAMDDVAAALNEAHMTAPNPAAAADAFAAVQTHPPQGIPRATQPPPQRAEPPDLLNPNVGGPPLVRTGSWASRRPLRRRLTPPCSHACPAGNDVQAFVAAAARQDYDRALAILLETSPLPAVCGRVCPAPCMEGCNRRLFDEAVNVREIERYAADHGAPPTFERAFRPERVAVVGSGPAGLTCAYHLARLGYATSLYESADHLGGVLYTGIPAYRLPREVLDREIEFILRQGINVCLGCTIDRRRLLRLSQDYDAVFVATGLQRATRLALGPDGAGCVLDGLAFLNDARRGRVDLTGMNVVVVGGGNTAVDAARSALRLGAHQVRILYRRTRAQMPAIDEELDEALREGVRLDELVQPLRLRREANGWLLTCTRMRLGEPDASGRAQPIPETTEDAQFDLHCDRVILALGQAADLTILPEGAEVHDGPAVAGLTAAPLFFGGDFATGEGTVAAAIGSGRRAALHIHRTLSGEDLFPPAPPPLATPEVVTLHRFTHRPREDTLELPAWLRHRNFAEVRLGYLDEPGRHPAAAEAGRCLSCGVCNACDACLNQCPEGILRRDADGYVFDYDYCKGCGLCAAACPRGVIYMAELWDESSPPASATNTTALARDSQPVGGCSR